MKRPVEKKNTGPLIFMYMPHIKFQDSRIRVSQLPNGVRDGWADRQTDRQAQTNMLPQLRA